MNQKIVMFTGDSITDCNRARPIGDGFGNMGTSYVARIFVDTWADFPTHNIHYLNSLSSIIVLPNFAISTFSENSKGIA